MFINYPDDWDLLSQVNNLQKRIILNSILYYELNDNALTDAQFTELCKQYLQTANEVELSKTRYGYVFDGFDGSTGFHLYGNLKNEDKVSLMWDALFYVYNKNNRTV